MPEFKGLPSSQTYFSTADLARLLDLTPQRVHQLIKDGKIEAPSVQVGRAYGFTPDQAMRIKHQRQAQEKGERWVTFAPEDPKRGER